jgi:ankyrin repeat protein
MTGRVTLQDLVREAGVTPVHVRQPLPPPSQPANIASEDDYRSARELLVQQRINSPNYKDPTKQLKRIFRSSKEKEKLLNPLNWEFSQEELDQALSAIIDNPSTTPGLVQAFLGLGAKVNFIETTGDKTNKSAKQANGSARRRSTVLQRAATVRRVDSVALLASSGADQTTLDEALKAAIASNNQASVLELLRHGADINKCPNALADAVRSNDLNFVHLLLRAPKAYRADVLSSCLPAAIHYKSEPAVSLLIGYGADPNFSNAAALCMAISQRNYRLAVAITAGSIRLTPNSLQNALEPTLRVPTAQELYQYLQLLFCCGMPSHIPGLPELLATTCKRNDAQLAMLLLTHGVSTSLNEAECLQNALSNKNWALAESILRTPLTSTHTTMALSSLPIDAPKPERYRVVTALLVKGANGPALTRWLNKAIEDGDSQLVELILRSGTSVASGTMEALRLAITKKDRRSLQMILQSKLPPESISKVFPLLWQNYTPAERLESAKLLLERGARGVEVDRALIRAITEYNSSAEFSLITELVRHGADVNFEDGRSLQLATTLADVPLLKLLLESKPSLRSTSPALSLAFSQSGARHASTTELIRLLTSSGVQQQSALNALQVAIRGGPQNLDIVELLVKKDMSLAGPALQCASELSDVGMAAPIFTALLRIGVPHNFLNDALINQVKLPLTASDQTLVKLLLDHGASVNYRDGAALSASLIHGSTPATELLLNGKESPTQSTVTRAFRALFEKDDNHTKFPNPGFRIAIARQLLQRGVDQSVIDSGLRTVLDGGSNSEKDDYGEISELLLHNNADVNTANGICFALAASREDFEMFAALLDHDPDIKLIVPSLIFAKLEEDIVVRALRMCFTHGFFGYDFGDTSEGQNGKLPPLIAAIQEYPRGDELTRLLVLHGFDPDSTASAIVDPANGVETVPALIWALAQPQKMVSSDVIHALLLEGASPTRPAPVSDISPIALAARERRLDIVQELLEKGADPSVRDKWNRSALFYASSSSTSALVQTLVAHALKNDGSLHEAARCLQLENAMVLMKHGHSANFPSRLHQGRDPLGELCLNAEITNGSQRAKARKLINLFLDNGADPKFKARNEKSTIILALDNPHNPLEIAEALLESEAWETLNDEKHMFRDSRGLWYSPIKYVELVPSQSRARHKTELIELLRDKACEPKFYSEGPDQPEGAIGMPPPVAELVDRQKAHALSLRLANEAHEHARMLEETSHRDRLRRQKEQQDAEMAAAAAAKAQWQALEQSKHDFEIQRVREAEHMKRAEKAAWHKQQVEQERDFAAQRLQIEDRKASAAYAHESRLMKQRQAELEHRTGLERKALLEKEQLFERNVKRQKELTDRLDESAQLHSRLRQERPAIEPAKWGSVD